MNEERRVAELDAELRSLADQDPAEAIHKSRTLLSGSTNQQSVAAGVLIDAGALTKDSQAIQEGVQVFRELSQKYPESHGFRYNLANGLVTLADTVPFQNLDWYLETSALRREGRSLFERVAANRGCGDELRSTAACNLANAYWKAHRWAEAYDAYLEALRFDSTNAIAQTGAARVLLRCAQLRLGKPSVLMAVAQRHIERSERHKDRLRELGGARAETDLSSLFEKKLPGGVYPDLSSADDYQLFVARNRLALNLTIEGLDTSLKRWDSLQIKSIAEPVSTEGVSPLYAMFNVMKADFLTARLLAYRALYGETPDSGTYADTLDYAQYGTSQSLLTIAQRTCIDVLDKMAVATSEYFGLAGRFIYFSNRWYGDKLKGGGLQWNPDLLDPIAKRNTALVALAEISLDIESGGALHWNKLLRHASTHRFIVTHDVGNSASRTSSFVDHYRSGDFGSSVIKSLQLTRAALLYFVDLIAQHERPRRRGSECLLSFHNITKFEERKMKIRCISNKLTRFPGTDFLDYGSPPRSAQRLANCSRFVTGSQHLGSFHTCR